MTTKTIAARNVHAGDAIVTGGGGDDIFADAGARRRAFYVAESRHQRGALSTFRAVLRGGAADGADAWLTFSAPRDARVRVTT